MKTRRAPGRSTLGREVCSGLNSIQVERETALEKTDRCTLGHKLVFNQGKNVVSNTHFTNAAGERTEDLKCVKDLLRLRLAREIGLLLAA